MVYGKKKKKFGIINKNQSGQLERNYSRLDELSICRFFSRKRLAVQPWLRSNSSTAGWNHDDGARCVYGEISCRTRSERAAIARLQCWTPGYLLIEILQLCPIRKSRGTARDCRNDRTAAWISNLEVRFESFQFKFHDLQTHLWRKILWFLHQVTFENLIELYVH